MPHLPQLLASVIVSTHVPLHAVPVVHWHLLLTHDAPDGHALLQLPQFEESLVVSTHCPPHMVPLHGFVVGPVLLSGWFCWIGLLLPASLFDVEAPESCLPIVGPPELSSLAMPVAHA